MQLDFFFLDFEYSTQLGLLFFCFLLFCPWSWSLDVEKKEKKKNHIYCNYEIKEEYTVLLMVVSFFVKTLKTAF